MRYLIGVLIAASALGQTPASKGVTFYSIEREIAFGKSVTPALERQVSVVHDAKVDAYLEGLGRLLRPADATFKYRFVIYKGQRLGSADDILGVAGGTIFIPLQSLADAANNASIAMKIGHAIAHIELRTTPMIAMGTSGFKTRPVPNATREAEADKMATSYLSGRQEDVAGFEAARTAARTALERN